MTQCQEKQTWNPKRDNCEDDQRLDGIGVCGYAERRILNRMLERNARRGSVLTKARKHESIKNM